MPRQKVIQRHLCQVFDGQRVPIDYREKPKRQFVANWSIDETIIGCPGYLRRIVIQRSCRCTSWTWERGRTSIGLTWALLDRA